jgi:hypothetical protein
MGVIINGGVNINNTGTIINAKSATSISINQYCRINQNGSININTDPTFGGVPPPLSTNLIISCNGGNASEITSVTIGGGPAYVIVSGAFPASVDLGNIIYAHHFGGTSVSAGEYNNATLIFSINGVGLEGGCGAPSFGPFNYTFTESDIITLGSSDCGG